MQMGSLEETPLVFSVDVSNGAVTCAKHWRPPQIPEWAPGRWLKNRRAEARVPPWDQKQQSDWWEHNSWGTKLRHDFRYTGGGSGLLLLLLLRSRSFQDGCPAFASFWFSKLKVLFEICRSPPPFVWGTAVCHRHCEREDSERSPTYLSSSRAVLVELCLWWIVDIAGIWRNIKSSGIFCPFWNPKDSSLYRTSDHTEPVSEDWLGCPSRWGSLSRPKFSRRTPRVDPFHFWLPSLASLWDGRCGDLCLQKSKMGVTIDRRSNTRVVGDRSLKTPSRRDQKMPQRCVAGTAGFSMPVEFF